MTQKFPLLSRNNDLNGFHDFEKENRAFSGGQARGRTGLRRLWFRWGANALRRNETAVYLQAYLRRVLAHSGPGRPQTSDQFSLLDFLPTFCAGGEALISFAYCVVATHVRQAWVSSAGPGLPRQAVTNAAECL